MKKLRLNPYTNIQLSPTYGHITNHIDSTFEMYLFMVEKNFFRESSNKKGTATFYNFCYVVERNSLVWIPFAFTQSIHLLRSFCFVFLWIQLRTVCPHLRKNKWKPWNNWYLLNRKWIKTTAFYFVNMFHFLIFLSFILRKFVVTFRYTGENNLNNFFHT